MQNSGVKRGRYRHGERAGIWLAITLALALHVIFLFLPIVGKERPVEDLQRPLEIQLDMAEKRPPATVAPAHGPAAGLREPAVAKAPEAPPAATQNPPAEPAAPPPVAADTPGPVIELDSDRLGEVEIEMLTSTILARQYITEESAVDRLFGRPTAQDVSDYQKDFHYPLRKDLIEMLNQPLPDLPFDYTPGLIYFAYDPGLKGELQRFWDVITPEFGWRTRYGTEVKCALILIIPGCVWK